MSKELGLTPVQMGWLFSSFAWAYVLAQIPAGWLVDRLGAKRTVTAGLVLWSLCTMFMGAAHMFVVLLVLRFLLGTFEAPVGPASARVIAAWFPSAERGMAGAILNSAQYLSLALFTPLMGWLDHMYGWAYVLSVMGTLGLLLAVVWWRNYEVPGKHSKLGVVELEMMRAGGALVGLQPPSAQSTQAKKDPNAPGIRDLFKSKMLSGIFLAQYCITAITWFFVSWFSTYLVKERGMTILTAGFVPPSRPSLAALAES